MTRLYIIQKIINQLSARNYLEIGVKKGKVFFEIKARKKIAVDPQFKIDTKRKIKSWSKNLSNIFNEYYEMTSDRFFEMHSNRLSQLSGLDVAFIDGLHTYKQSLKDVQNCLSFLKQNGVIFMHDCNPISEAESYPTLPSSHVSNLNLPGWTGAWCGEVWKTIAHLRSTRSDLNIFVLNCDHGVGVITRGTPDDILDYSPEAINNLSYHDLARDREMILNLKKADFLDKFLKI